MVEPTAWEAAAAPGRRIGHTVEAHGSIGSTNDRAAELLGSPDGEGVAVVAEEQVAGRGRRGRTWTSPPGVNVMVSVGVRPRLAAAEAWRLGLAVALAARDACASVTPVELKWPNDLVASDGRKVGGILVETAIDGGRVGTAVVGIGINVNWWTADMPAEIRPIATSLAELAGAAVDRVALLGRILAALDVEIATVEAGTSPLDRYRAACRTIGTAVEVTAGEATLRGHAIDLDTTGGLVLQTDAGRVTVASGEVARLRAGAMPG